MSQFTKSILLLCVFMLLSVQTVFGGTPSVNITNSLKGKLDLTLHCRSKERDLGTQLLHHGASFGWHITRTFFSVIYSCVFKWNESRHYYDNFGGAPDKCIQCNWYVTESGPCNILSSGSVECHSWTK